MVSWLHRYPCFLGLLFVSILLSACQLQFHPPAPTGSGQAPDWITIETHQEGVYRVKLSEIREAGLAITDLQADEVVLWRKGQAIPFQIVDQGQALLFYARPATSVYSPGEFYWLLLADAVNRLNASLYIPVADALSPPLTSAPDTAWLPSSADQIARAVHLEENRLYTPQVENGDHWLWEAYSAPVTQLFNLNLPSVGDGQGRLHVRVWARTEGRGTVDHHWKLWLNDQQLDNAVWDGKGIHEFFFAIPSSGLIPGDNKLEIQVLNDTGLKADIVYLDRIDLEYTGSGEPEADQLTFQALGESLAIDGFSGEVIGFQTSPAPGLSGLLTDGDILPTTPGYHYWLAGPQSWLTPESISPGWLAEELDSLTEPLDYLAIGPRLYLESIEPLLQYHRQQGLAARYVAVEDLYNHFSGGFPEPEAIQRFVQDIARQWSSPPGYLLLVGDSSYDLRGYLGPVQANQLPAFFVDTIFGGQTASDLPFAMLDEDELPDLAVGRVPAATVEQVERFVKKTLVYAERLEAQKEPSILAIADGQDPNFGVDASRFLDQFPVSMPTRLLIPAGGATNASQQVLDSIQQGYWLVAYFGHGSINMWGRDRLITSGEVAQLDNPDASMILVNMTCLTGLFTHPEIQSLAEAMLFQEPGGAVAVLAPTSLTLPGDQSFLSEALAAALSSSETVVMGDVLLQARRSIPLESPGAKDVLLTFLLFGDPALKVR